MPEAVTCPYYSSGHCNLSGSSQSDYQKENYCVTEKSSEQWKSCPNYQGASETARIEKKVR